MGGSSQAPDDSPRRLARTSASTPTGLDSSSCGRRDVVVPTGGWTWGDVMMQVVVVAMFPVAVLFVIYLSGPRPPNDVLPRLVGIIAFLAVVDLFVTEVGSPRVVRIDPDGVTFRFLLHSERRRWQDLEPSRMTPRHGGWGVVSRSRNGRPTRQRTFAVTIGQARAILNYPNCPPWTLPPNVQRGLGLV